MPLIDSYKDLITSQHRDKPKYMATVTALLRASEDVFSLGVMMDEAFDLDAAVGAQEDRLGVIVGANRRLPFQPEKNLSPELDNEAYRNLLKARIVQNLWKGGIEDLKTAWDTLFGSGIIIQDNQDMTIDVVVVGIADQITKDMILQGLIVPKPQSVRVNFHFSAGAVFGYDMETNAIRGYDHADWMYDNPLQSFAYDTVPDKNFGGYEEGHWE